MYLSDPTRSTTSTACSHRADGHSQQSGGARAQPPIGAGHQDPPPCFCKFSAVRTRVNSERIRMPTIIKGARQRTRMSGNMWAGPCFISPTAAATRARSVQSKAFELSGCQPVGRLLYSSSLILLAVVRRCISLSKSFLCFRRRCSLRWCSSCLIWLNSLF